MTYGPSLEILEVAYEVSPGGVRTFEIYDKSEIEPVQIPIFETNSRESIEWNILPTVDDIEATDVFLNEDTSTDLQLNI